MHTKHSSHVKNLILPCLGFSMVTGFFAAIIITVFKILAEWTIHLSSSVYSAARANPMLLPALVVGAAAIGFAASFILSLSHSCRGGGIPTSISAIRGIVSFRWLKSLLLLPISALLTFLAGLPLGTEGPCVQMGAAVGDGVSKTLGKDKHKGWRRYIMTGGASAGFSIATASPISAIIFAMEELHKRFSPMLLSVASISVIVAQLTMRALAFIGIGEVGFLSVPAVDAMAHTKFFVPILVGITTGLCSIFFTRLYHFVDRMMHIVLDKLSIKIVLPALFAITCLVGFFFAEALGTGHSLVTSLFTPGKAWYILILALIIRALGMTISNTSGTTGGVFLPTLAFGAIIGALCANVMIALGWIGSEYYVLIVVLGITSFLGSTSRIPLTAAVFAVEAMGGITNILPVILAVTVSLLIVEASGIEDFTDTVLNAQVKRITRGKQALDIEVPLTVAHGSFAIGKELHDILWPNSCVVLAFNGNKSAETAHLISEGDVITVRYVTYNSEATAEELAALVGEQPEEAIRLMNPEIQ